MQARMLIVDDDLDMREALDTLFSGEGHACELAADATSALEIVERQTFDVVISDVRMAGMNGLELLDRVKRSHPALPFIIITAAGAIPQAVDAIKRGAFEYVAKPCDSDDLRPDRHRRARGAAAPERDRAGSLAAVRAPGDLDLVGTGPAMRTLQTTIDFVAQSSAPVLITGETGVGKELVARAIHARSARSRVRSWP